MQEKATPCKAGKDGSRSVTGHVGANAGIRPYNRDGTGYAGWTVAQEILEKLALWVKSQAPEKLSVQNLKHATGVLKDIREILKSDTPDAPTEIKVQIGNEEYAE